MITDVFSEVFILNKNLLYYLSIQKAKGVDLFSCIILTWYVSFHRKEGKLSCMGGGNSRPYGHGTTATGPRNFSGQQKEHRIV